VVLGHLREGETELFGKKGTRDFDETQISDVRDDASAIGIEEHHLHLCANARRNGHGRISNFRLQIRAFLLRDMQNDHSAISWLMLGHGTGDASRGDLAMLPLAASSLLGKEGSPTIAQRFGLDTLGLRGAGTESQFVTAGKRIADRLYVGFEQSLGAAESILKLEFDLSRRVLLRAQTGDSNAVGVFYRYSFD